MKALTTKLFSKKIKTLNIIQIINAGLILLYAATFPMLVDQQKTLDAFIQSMPKEFLKAFSIDNGAFLTFEGYLASKHFMPFWVIILLVVVIPAATFISKSLDNYTAELIFPQPLTRIKSGLAVFTSVLLQAFYFTAISILIIIPICWIFKIDVHYVNYCYLLIESLAFVFFITALTFALDIFINDAGKVTGLIILFTVGSYILSLIAKIITDLDILKYFSVFYYYDPSNSLGLGKLGLIGIAGFTVTGITLIVLAMWRFYRKDLIK